ncbi:MAG: CdaR family protein [Chloroflexota bacterium]
MIPNAWKDNLYWIAFSLALSTILWMVISGQQNPYREDVINNVVVEVQNLPPDLVVRGNRPTVSVTVSAPQDMWRQLEAGSVHAQVDASKVSAGRQTLPVKVQAADWRVKIERWQPSSLEIEFETAAKKSVPVRVNVLGEAPFGYVSRPATVSPQQVTVAGPESLVTSVAKVQVDVKLLEAKSTINEQLVPTPVDANGDEVKGVSVVPEVVAVEVPIEQQVSYKTVPVVPRVVGSVAIGYQLAGLMVEPTTVTVVGDPATLRDLNYVTTAPVNISSAVSDVTVNTELDLPRSVSMVRPQGIIVRAYVGAAEGTQIVTVAPTVIGLGDGLVATTLPEMVKVTVVGPVPVLNTLKAQDVRIELDVSGLAPGNYPLSLTATVPEPLKVTNVNPDNVIVFIKR